MDSVGKEERQRRRRLSLPPTYHLSPQGATGLRQGTRGGRWSPRREGAHCFPQASPGNLPACSFHLLGLVVIELLSLHLLSSLGGKFQKVLVAQSSPLSEVSFKDFCSGRQEAKGEVGSESSYCWMSGNNLEPTEMQERVIRCQVR